MTDPQPRWKQTRRPLRVGGLVGGVWAGGVARLGGHVGAMWKDSRSRVLAAKWGLIREGQSSFWPGFQQS